VNYLDEELWSPAGAQQEKEKMDNAFDEFIPANHKSRCLVNLTNPKIQVMA
jgi:hypothetical protein